jgi:hypothetical protein
MRSSQLTCALDLRPEPVLTIGVTGHRRLQINSADAHHMEESVRLVLGTLRSSLEQVVTADASFFSAHPPRLRIISMIAEGADVLVCNVARSMKIQISCVLPFPANDYLQDFTTPERARMTSQAIDDAAARLVLPGSRNEGDRAYERANQVILAHSDILLAVWDGARAAGRGGTGDVVQAAVDAAVPTVVVNPQPLTDVMFIRAPTEIEFDGPSAFELPRRPLSVSAATELVRNALGPPSGNTQRQNLQELFEETAPPKTWRVEYPILLKVVAFKSREKLAHNVAIETKFAQAADEQHQSESKGVDRLLGYRLRRLDALAAHYSQKYRSSVVSGSIFLIVAAAIPGIVGLLVPQVAGQAIILQVVANGLILIDGYIREKNRWQERWLDFRTTAERLRSLLFLQPLGLAAAAPTWRLPDRRGGSVGEWYVTRGSREFGPPSSAITASEVAALKERLIHVHINEQVRYHRQTARQLGGLDRCLRLGARVALGGAAAVGFAFAVSVYNAGTAAVGWKGVAMLLLVVLPAATTAFNALRAEADLVRLVERSIGATVTLRRMASALRALQPTYDAVAVAAGRVAGMMGAELYDWRFVLESRQSRLQRRKRGRG